MTDLTTKTKDFIMKCAEEVEEVYDQYDRHDTLQYTVIQLTGLVFKLEERIEELENV